MSDSGAAAARPAPTRDEVARVLQLAGADVDTYGALRLDAIESRDRHILWAIDHGYERRWVAIKAGISPARVTQIVARRVAC